MYKKNEQIQKTVFSAASQNADAESWVELYSDSLYSYALSKTRDREKSKDLIQETLLSAIKARGSLTPGSNVKAWLITILKNKIIDAIRQDIRRGPLTSIEDLPEIPIGGMSSLGFWSVYVPDWARLADEQIEQKEFQAALKLCFQKMPDRFKTVFRLKHLEGLEQDEICKVTQVSASNYWVILHRGRLAIRSCIEKNWYRKDEI